jgi:hypothetical protein
VTRYAETTSVAAEKSRAEIEGTLARYGADQFMYGWDAENAVIAFRMNARQVRSILPMPDKSDREFTHTPGKGLARRPEDALRAWEQATRQRWRALALVVKAKLEAVEAGITEFEDEFLAHIVLPSGQTMGQWARPRVHEAYETGLMPTSLLALPSGDAGTRSGVT